MENKIVHQWRCIHCGEMTDTYICAHCGKESYVKDKDETTIGDEKLKTTERQAFKSDKEKTNTTVPLPEGEIKGLKREVTKFAERINVNVAGIGKTIKSIAWVFAVLFIVQAGILVINFRDMKRNVHSLEETNKELSTLVHSQSEKISSLEKTVAEAADSQIKYIVHTVAKGETLTRICQQYNIDLKANQWIICSLNGIENHNFIRVGQKLLLPVFD